jgi:prepilin-type N-terminal cleavage/methylation domain-containing protein
MKKIKTENGFTMMELMAVIAIMGILAGVGIVALGGIGTSGRQKACATDLQALRSAQEAYFAKTAPSSLYGNEAALASDTVLPQLSRLHAVTVGATTAAATAATDSDTSAQTGAAYVIKVQDASCGAAGTVVGP